MKVEDRRLSIDKPTDYLATQVILKADDGTEYGIWAEIGIDEVVDTVEVEVNEFFNMIGRIAQQQN